MRRDTILKCRYLKQMWLTTNVYIKATALAFCSLCIHNCKCRFFANKANCRFFVNKAVRLKIWECGPYYSLKAANNMQKQIESNWLVSIFQIDYYHHCRVQNQINVSLNSFKWPMKKLWAYNNSWPLFKRNLVIFQYKIWLYRQ